MENPLFLILIVTRNRDINREDTKDLFNGGGTSEMKSSNDPRIVYKKTKYTYSLNHEAPPDDEEPQGNNPAKQKTEKKLENGKHENN